MIGVIDVNWSLIDREVKRNLDLNKDGVVDIKDLGELAFVDCSSMPSIKV